MKTVFLGAFAAIALALAAIPGCTYYVAPAAYDPPVSTFDRSWAAINGAFNEEGIPVTYQDRGAGQVRGTRDGIDVTADLRTQADGNLRLEVRATGATSRDPGLMQRISNAYNRRMGR